MSLLAATTDGGGADRPGSGGEPAAPRGGRPEDELVMHLERDQLVAETSRPVQRAALSARASAVLWALRILVTVVGLMVVYVFIDQLH